MVRVTRAAPRAPVLDDLGLGPGAGADRSASSAALADDEAERAVGVG